MDSELQIALIALGVAVVVGIIAYNKWQERKHRKHAESAFRSDHRDVLLEPQEQYGNVFRVVRDGGYRVLLRKGRRGDYQQTYRFRPRARSFDEWNDPGDDLREFARGLAAAGTLVRGRAFETGQRILIGRRYVVVDDGYDHLRVLVNDDEHREVVAEILGTGHGRRT